MDRLFRFSEDRAYLRSASMLLKSILVFEIKLLGDPACCLLEARLFTCSSSYTSSLEMELGAFIRVGRHVDPLCFTSSLGIESVCLLILMRDLFLLYAGRNCVLHRSYPSA